MPEILSVTVTWLLRGRMSLFLGHIYWNTGAGGPKLRTSPPVVERHLRRERTNAGVTGSNPKWMEMKGTWTIICYFYTFSVHLKFLKIESLGKKHRPSERIAYMWSFHVRCLLVGVRPANGPLAPSVPAYTLLAPWVAMDMGRQWSPPPPEPTQPTAQPAAGSGHTQKPDLPQLLSCWGDCVSL